MATPTIPEPVASFITNVNNHDRQAFLDAFTSDGVVDDWGRVFSGHDQIGAWSDKDFIGSQGILAVEEVDLTDGKITIVGDWRSNHANGRSKFTFDVTRDLIATMTIREG